MITGQALSTITEHLVWQQGPQEFEVMLGYSLQLEYQL
jgi:hypothetical protein